METEELVSAFANFKSLRLKLETLLTEVQRRYKDLNSSMPRETNLNIQPLLLSEDQKSQVTRIFHDPKLMIVGQTNAGKSSLINEILGFTIVKAEDVPCTSRIVECVYGENKFPIIEVIDKNGKIIKTKALNSMAVPSGILNLSGDDRNNPELIGSKVRIKVNIPFLKSGVEIVDTPGKNEYEALDRLIEEHMKSVLPLVIYVIDGTNMLTLQDIADIDYLRRYVPRENIFFVVTKCDDPDLMENDDEDSDSDNENAQMADRSIPSELEREIREGIYDKLVDKHYLERQPLSERKNYHALSSRYIKKYRWSLREPIDVDNRHDLKDCQRFMDDFIQFKSELVQFIRRQLIQTAMYAAKTLQASLSNCIDYYAAEATSNIRVKSDNESNIIFVENGARQGSREMQNLIRESEGKIERIISDALKENKLDKRTLAKNFKFVKHEVPEDGRIRNMLVNEYKTELREHVAAEIGNIIHKELIRKCAEDFDHILTDVSTKVYEMQQGLNDNVKFHDALQEMYVRQYQSNIRHFKVTRSYWQIIKNALETILHVLFLGLVIDCVTWVNVMDNHWRIKLVDEVKNLVNPSELAETIISNLCEHVANGYESFTRKLEDVRQLYRTSHELGESNRKFIQSQSPLIARLELAAWDIIDSHHYDSLNCGEIIGRGAQGVVVDCDAKGPNDEQCVAKVIKVEHEDELGNLGLELHYSRRLKHDNIAEIYGTVYTKHDDETYRLSIIMPRMECDLFKALPSMINLKDRLQVAVQVAQALEYIHARGLMHRDIKCQNILLDAQNNVRIIDFGFCKPPGLSDGSIVGTPIHMAPEIFQSGTHDEKVDVYAFGITLWFICEGKGNLPNRVQGINILVWIIGSVMGAPPRPEQLEVFRGDCWELMVKCWADDPTKRPAMKEVVSELESIIMKL